MRRSSSNPQIIPAKYPGTCAETGSKIRPGESILWTPGSKSVFSISSHRFQQHESHLRALEVAKAFNLADADW